MTIGTALAYLLHSAFYLAMGYAAYKIFLSRMKMPAFNRAVILTIYAVALTAPALMPVNESIIPAEAPVPEPIAESGHRPALTVQSSFSSPSAPEEMSDLTVAMPTTPSASYTLSEPEATVNDTPTLTMHAACALAAAGAVLLLLHLLLAIRKIVSLRLGGEMIRFGNTHLILIDDNRLSPFSLLNFIFMSRSDYRSGESMILEHELSHIRHLHFIDLLISKVTLIAMWWNPMAWLLHRELRAVHEFQADAGVLGYGHRMKEYQLLLIKKAAGARLPSVASSLNHSKLKQRFTMMYQKSPSRWARLRAMALIPAFCGAVLFTGQTSFASIADGLRDVALFNADAAEAETGDEMTPAGVYAGKITQSASNEQISDADKDTDADNIIRKTKCSRLGKRSVHS